MEERGFRQYVAELIGTFVLVAMITMVVSLYGPSSQFVLIGLVHAFVLSMLVYTLGSVSGAHFNPAVSIGLAAIRKIRPQDALVYVMMQLTGAVLGALFTKGILLDEGGRVAYGATKLAASTGGALEGLVVEAVFTFLLVWAIVGIAVNPKSPRDWAGWVIGATLGFLVMVAAPLTGAGLNPARSFGPALIAGEWSDFWLYVIGPVLGGLTAAVLYNWLFIFPQKSVTSE